MLFLKERCIADDILLISHSVYELQKLYDNCEKELLYLDMAINVKKTCCMRIGSRHKNICSNIINGFALPFPWVNNIKYLGIVFVSSYSIKCSFSHIKIKYFRAVNSIFSKIGRSASEETFLHLVNAKCMPILLYALDVCPLNKSDINSFDFVVNRFLFKLFRTNNRDLVEECRFNFSFLIPSEMIPLRQKQFMIKLTSIDNFLCQYATFL